MSLVADLHAAHLARVARLNGGSANKAPANKAPSFPQRTPSPPPALSQKPALPPKRDWLLVATEDPPPPPEPTLMQIKRVVCTTFNISHQMMVSHRRPAEIVRPRFIAMFLAKKMTSLSLPMIGQGFGKRDHTTVMYAVERAEVLIARDLSIAAQVRFLEAQIRLEVSDAPCRGGLQ